MEKYDIYFNFDYNSLTFILDYDSLTFGLCDFECIDESEW